MSAYEDTLRTWAKGMYNTEAAVELLIRAGFAHEGLPWCEPDGRVNFETLLDQMGVYSGGEQRVMRIAASLVDAVEVDLGENIPGLDRKNLGLVLAAIAHAAGSHEHSDLVTNPDGTATITPLASLYPWPST